MDEADMAQAQEENALKTALSRRYETLRAIGYCYSCNEQLAGALRFCDRDCMEDWERVQAARRRNGA